MFRLTVLQGGREGERVGVASWPFVIGKESGADLRTDDRGVWPRHAVLDLDPERELPRIRRLGEGTVSLNHAAVRESVLRSGDRIALGGLVLEFGAAPVPLRRLERTDVLAWGLVGLGMLIELGLLLALLLLS